VTYYEEQDLCPICGLPCELNEHDTEGNPIHEECKVNRNAMEADNRRE